MENNVRVSSRNSRTRNSLLNLLTSLGGHLLLTVMRFATRTVLIRTLGKMYLGINGYFSDIIYMLSLTELGFDTAINFKLYKPLAEHDEKRVRVLMNFYKMAYRGVGFAILLIGFCIIPLLPVLIKDYEVLPAMGVNAPLVFVLFLLQSASSYLFFAYRAAVMQANQKKYILDVADYAVTIFSNITQILILIFLKDFIAYTLTVVAFNIIQNILNAIITQRYYPEYFIPEKERLTKEEVKDLFKDCGALFIYKINVAVLKATDNMVLGAFAGLSIIGMYSNYLLFYTSIRALLRRFYSAVKASMGNLFVTEGMEKKYRFFETMNFLTIILYGTGAVGVSVCANELISVWVGADYLIPQPFPVLIGMEILISGLKQNLSQIRTITGAFRQMWYRPLMGIFINIILSIALVQVIGIYGVIIGTLVADLSTSFVVDPPVIHRICFEGFRPVSRYYRKNGVYVLILAVLGMANMLLARFFFCRHGWISVIIHALFVAVSVPSAFLALFRNMPECRYLINLAVSTVRKINGMMIRFGTRKA